MKRTLYTILICMLTWKVSADTDKLLPFMVDGVIDTTNYETAGLEPTPGIKTVTIFKAGEQTDHYANGVLQRMRIATIHGWPIASVLTTA